MLNQKMLNLEKRNKLESLGRHRCPWPRQIIDYSHIAQCKNVEPWWWKANPKGFGSLPAPQPGYATTIMVFMAHLLIIDYSDHRQNLISSSLYNPGSHQKL